MLDELEHEQKKIVKFKRCQAKKIKCIYCEHKGRSIVEEQQPWATYVIALALYLLVGFWSILLFPFIVGLLR